MSQKSIMSAIDGRICYETFWWNRDTFKLGTTVQFTTRQVGNATYAWSNDLSRIPNVSEWANFYTIYSLRGQPTVVESFGYNVSVMHNVAIFQQQKSLVFAPGSETLELHVPKNCTPKFSKTTELKQEIISAILASIENELATLNRYAGSNCPNQLSIIIADFNTDYPEALVLIPKTREVFWVALFDTSDPQSNAFLRNMAYLVYQENDFSVVNRLIPKILKYGFAYNINLCSKT